MKKIDRIRTSLKNEIETLKRLSKRYKRIYNSLLGEVVGSTGVTVTLAGVSLGVMKNPVTLIPIVSVNIGLAGIGVLTGVFSKLVVKRIKIYNTLDLL